MFVKDNSIKSVEDYFKEKLDAKFSINEIKLIYKAVISKRLNFEESEYIMYKNSAVSESDLLFFRDAIKRLLANEPLQHIVGCTEFYGLKIKTSKAALIPRPETEELVNWILEDAKEYDKIEDWCTGTGCIALALKANLKNANITGYDISKDALSLAKENNKALKLDIQLAKADALNIENVAVELDTIVSNPPYIPNKDKTEMHANVLDFEPGLALFVEDEDPLLFYREIGKYAYHSLKNGGKLYFELHEDYAMATKELMISIGFFNVVIKKDLQGKERMLRAVKLN